MAASPDVRKLYPHATPGGEAIPFDIIRPLGLVVQAFGAAAVNDVAIPAAADYLYMEATEDCYVQLDDDAAAPANGAHTLGLIVLLAGTGKVIDHNAAEVFGVIKAGADDGTLFVQTISKYADVRKPAVSERGA